VEVGVDGRTVVVGGGCSGTFAVRSLVRAGARRVILIESGEPGPGLAYGPAEPWHLLNSPAGSISADVDDPDGFVTFCPGAERADFLPRAVYGSYLRHVLESADPVIVRGRAVRIAGGGVVLADGRVIAADRVVLALGYTPPDPLLPAHPRCIANPWDPSAFDRVRDGPVLLLGTGLTAVDVVLSLVRRGWPGPIVAQSRHGLTPLPHVHGTKPAPIEPPVARELSVVLRAARRLAATGDDWRSTVDGLRPHADTIWRGLTPAGRERFLRHVERVWEVHRSRIAPAVAAEIAALRASGRLSIRAGRAGRVAPVGGGVEVDGVRYAAVVNCTGPGRLTASRDPLVRSLLADGRARPGPFGLGLDVTRDGAVIGVSGGASDRLWTLGPPRRGRFWETRGIVEIRAQACAIPLLSRRT
jgi:uncharacterized NAD(P)/FAD-binding protein YdhS